MIKSLPLILLFAVISTIGYGQCTPDPQYTTPGYYPLEGLPDIVFNEPYSEAFTLVIPADSSIGFLTSTIDSIVITSITGVPDGMVTDCFPTNCVFLGDDVGCIGVTGTVTDTAFIGDNPLVVSGLIYGSLLPGLAIELDEFALRVVDPVSAPVLRQSSFELSQNRPNPFGQTTQITLRSPKSDNFTFRLTDMLGKEVQAGSFAANAGLNTVEFDGTQLPDGFYFYTLTNGVEKRTMRMIVSH